MKTLFYILMAGIAVLAILANNSVGGGFKFKMKPVQVINNQIKEDAYFNSYRIREYIKRMRSEGKVPTFIDNPKWRDVFRDKNEADVLFFE